MDSKFQCPCGGGQNCIVDRRVLKDWVYEDTIFKTKNIPIRKNCSERFTKQQKKVLSESQRDFDSVFITK